jgi:hypothetical protein
LRTPTRLLLALYAIIPVALAVVLLDVLVLGERLREMLPSRPEKVRAFTVFFMFPHIIASLLLYADARYLRRYRTRLSVGAVTTITLVFAATALAGIYPVYFVFSVLTVYHVVGQQLGITRSIAGVAGTTYALWKWSALAFALLVYGTVVAPASSLADLSLPAGSVEAFLGGLFVGTTLLVARLAKESRSGRGRRYVYANQALLGAMGLTALAGYPFFAILMPRFVHDTTAFAFYVPHDVNRNTPIRHNWLYRRIPWVPVALCGPLLGVLLAFPLQEWSYDSMLGYQILICVALMHYFVESFGWKRDSEARKSIQFG